MYCEKKASWKPAMNADITDCCNAYSPRDRVIIVAMMRRKQAAVHQPPFKPHDIWEGGRVTGCRGRDK